MLYEVITTAFDPDRASFRRCKRAGTAEMSVFWPLDPTNDGIERFEVDRQAHQIPFRTHRLEASQSETTKSKNP